MSHHISLEQKIKYLNRRLIEIDELKKYIIDEDFDAAFATGHRLKGNGSTFGFPDISKLGLTLELAALEGNKEKLSEVIEEIESNVKEHLELLH